MEENQQQESQSPAQKSNSSMMAIITIIVLVIVAGGGYVFYKKVLHKPVQPAAVMSAQSTPAMSPTNSAKNEKDEYSQNITITGSNFTFDQKELHVKKGQQVTITFKNSEGFHNFVIDAFNVKTPIIKAGQTATVSFTPDKTGTFQYYCSVGTHKQMGMFGNLIVE